METKFSGRKPPLHPGSSWSERRWIAEQLRSEAPLIKSTSIKFVHAVRSEYNMVEKWRHGHGFVIDLAQLVLTKVRSASSNKRRRYDRSSVAEDSPSYLLFAAAKLFARAVQHACKIKAAWWPDNFTCHLVRLVKIKLRKTIGVDARPSKKLKRSAPVDRGRNQLDVDAIRLKKLKIS